MRLYPKYACNKRYNDSKQRKNVEPASSVFPSEHHENASEQIGQHRGALRLDGKTLVLAVDALYCFRLVEAKPDQLHFLVLEVCHQARGLLEQDRRLGTC